MLINEHSPNLIRILSGDAKLTQLSALGQKLTQGQVIQGKVLDILSGGKALLEFNGQRLTAETAGALTKGQTIFAQVEQLLPNLILKIIRQPGLNTPQASTPDVTTKLSAASSAAGGENRQKLLNTLLSELNLKPGQSIQGKISQVLDNKTVQVQFQGKQLPVQITGDSSMFRPGGEITVNVQRGANGLTLVAQTPGPGFRQVDAAMIKPLLAARQDLAKMAANLEKTVLDNPLLKGLKIDPDLVARLRDTVRVLLPKDEALPDSSRLKEQVDRSGINYETKIKKFVAEKLTPENKMALARDLKGQLLELQSKLENHARLEAQRIASTTGQGRVVQELLHHVKQAANSIELQQLSNQFAKQENHPILIQIPDPFSPGTKTARLYIRRDEQGKGKKQGEKKDFNLVFLLNLTHLGNLRVDAKLHDNDVTAKITTQNKAVADFIGANTSKLESRLKEAGFNAAVTSGFKEKMEMEVEEDLERILINEPSRLVDIRT